MKLLITIVACVDLLGSSSIVAKEKLSSELIVGQWKGPKHVRVFYRNGDFTLDPEPEGRAVGRWKIVKDRLTIRITPNAPETTERILRLSEKELVVSIGGRNYAFRRVDHY